MCQIINLECVITRHRMAALSPINALNVRQTVFHRTEINATAVTVEEEQVPESRHFSSQLQILFFLRAPIENQVRKHSLLLLPEVLGVSPGEVDRPAVFRLPFHR